MKNSKYLVVQTARSLTVLSVLFLNLAMADTQTEIDVGSEGVASHFSRWHKDTGILQNESFRNTAGQIAKSESFSQFQTTYQTIKQFEETSYYLKDVCFISEDIGWAVGEPHWDQTEKQYKGTLIKTLDGGETWAAQETGVSKALRRVSFVDVNTGWAVGENGTILHTTDGGGYWEKQTVATSDEFRGVVFTDAYNGWATSIRPIHYDWLGYPDNWQGSIWHTGNGGITWKQQSAPGGASLLNRIDFIDSQNGWTVGIKYTGDVQWGDPQHKPVIYHTSNGGQTWVEQYSSDLDVVFTAVDFIDNKNGWVVGFKQHSSVTGTVVFHTSNGGITWVRQDGPEYGVSDVLWDVHFLDLNRGYAAGFNPFGPGPALWRTRDGGTTWEAMWMEDDEGELLYAVSVKADRVVTLGKS